ncbi:hypothetical protein FRX31_033876 [Thalictrum thalictroides]|uniref:Uncharacterized protein n=1 Tax=Thalictrum thalictroides TaxID=46969 RepID=A0A7J6UVD9_THATH|nr:hypothetical protein FRX31_033876 [Thalictrum thalictroides]
MGKLEEGSPVRDTSEFDSEKREENMESRRDVEKDLEGLEAAFRRRWNHENYGEIIELGEEAGEDEERWQRSLIGKLQTKRWFGEEEIKKELIRNWNISNKFEFMMVAEGHDYGVCKEMKDGIRRFNRELTREELKRVKKFSFLQKAKSYKFGAGIQVRHAIEVDPLAEMEINDHKFRMWKESKHKEGERLKKELTKSDLEGNLSLTKSSLEGTKVSSEYNVTTDKTCLYQLPGFKVVREEVMGGTEGFHKGERTEDKVDVAMLTPDRGRSVTLDKQGGGAEDLDGLTAMDFSPNPGKMSIDRGIRSVDMTEATEGSRNKASTSRAEGGGFLFRACKKLLFQNTFEGRDLKIQAHTLLSDLEHLNPKTKPKTPVQLVKAQFYKTTTCNLIAPKKPKLTNQKIVPQTNNPTKSSPPKALKRKLESELVSGSPSSYSSPAQALVPEGRPQKYTNEGEKDGNREEIIEVLENRKPKSQTRRPKNGNRHKPQGGQTDRRGTVRESHSNKEEINQTGDKRRKITHSSSVCCNPSDLLFSGNFKKVWFKFLSDPKMRRSYVGTSSRNEKKERIIRGNADAGAVNMKAEDRRNFNQVVFDDLIEKTRAVRGMSLFAPEAIQVGKQISDLKEKGFSFAKALTINGDHTTEEADEDYALFLIAYAEDTEKIADDMFDKEEECNNSPKGDSEVAGNDQPPSS